MGCAHRMTKAMKTVTIWGSPSRMVSYLIAFGGMKYSGLGSKDGQNAIK